MPASCDDVFATVIHRERVGDTAGASNSELDWIGANCPAESKIWADYMSAKGLAEFSGPDPCDSWTQYIGRSAIDLLREDGLCSDTADIPLADAPAIDQEPGGGVSWSEATNYVGMTQRVCGPLRNTGSSGDDVFLNLGREYPDPERFTIVLWDIGAIEPLSPGTTLCASGEITIYEGVGQMQLRSAGAVEVYE